MGPTRAMLDIREQNSRCNIAAKAQILNSIKAEIEKLHTRIEDQFEELELSLKTYSDHPTVIVRQCAHQLNERST